jgi:outer membrane protein
MTYKKGLLYLFFCAFNLSLNAQQNSFTLEQAQAFALKNAYNIQKALAEVDRSKSVVKETTAIGLPQVNASGRFSNFIDIPVSVVPAEVFGGEPGELAELQFGTKYSINAGVSASQLIFDGSYIVGLQAARAYQMLAQQGLKKSEVDIKEQVAQAYFAAAVLEESISLLDSTLVNTNKLLNESAALQAQGLIDEIDVDQLALQVETLRNQLSSAERNYKISKNILKFQMGMALDADFSLAQNITELSNTAYKETTLSDLSFTPNNNIDFKLAESSVLLQELNVKNKRANFLPQLAAFYNYEQNAFRNNFDFFSNTTDYFPTNVWGLSINVPIFSSGMKHQQVQQARIELKVAEIDRKMAEESLRLEFQQSMENLKTALENQENSKRRFELSERILKRTEIKNKEGISSSLELTQIQNQFIEARQAYLNATLEVLKNKATLHKITKN